MMTTPPSPPWPIFLLFYNEKIIAAPNYCWCLQSPPKLLHTKKFMVRLWFLCSLSFH